MFWGLLAIGLPISAVIAAIIYLPFYFISRKQGDSKWRHFVCYLFVGSCVIVSFATLFIGINLDLNYRKLNLRPFIWLIDVYEMGFRPMIEQLILNVAMFVPFGILLPIVFKGLRGFFKTTFCAFCMTFFIEFVQYFTGRSADIDDLIMNLSGGMIGYGIYYVIRHLCQDRLGWKKINAITDDAISNEEDHEVETISKLI